MSELNLKETISTTMKEIASRETPEEKDEVEAPVEEKEEPEAQEAEESDDPTEEAHEQQEQPKDQAPQKEIDRSLVVPPSTWTAKGKALWGGLSEDARREIRRREENARKGIEMYKGKADFGDRIDRILTPYQPFLKAKGAQAERVVEDAVNLAYQLETSNPQQKAVILKRIAQQYGADLGVLTQQPNPEDARLNQALAPLQQKLAEYERERQNSLHERQQQHTSQITQTIEGFANAVDDTGKLKHPFFDDVRDVMAALLESNRVSTLDQAYDFAVRADPEISKLAVSHSSQRISEDAKARALKAQKNQKVAAGKKPLVTGTPKSGSMADTIRQKLKEIRAN